MVGQGARLRHQANGALARDGRGRDAGKRLTRRNDSWAVRTNNPGATDLLGVSPELSGVLNRDSLGNDDKQGNTRVDGFHRGVLGERGGHEGHRYCRSGLGHRLGDGAKDGQSNIAVGHGFASLTGVHATNNLGASGEHQSRVLAALTTGDALNDDFRVLIEKN